MILYLTSDLMMSSTVSSLARENEQPIKFCRKLEKLPGVLKEHPVQLMLVDLQMTGMDFDLLVEALSQNIENRPHVIAYAQHVHDELLQRANDTPIDQVMTRGQFNASISQILENCERPALDDNEK